MLDSEYYVRGCLDPKAAEASKQDQPDPIAILSEPQMKMLNDVTIDPDHRLTEEQKLQVRRLVAENISAFATDPKNPASPRTAHRPACGLSVAAAYVRFILNQATKE